MDLASPAGRGAFAAASALTVLTWYALPDAVRSRGARTFLKAGLLGFTALGAAQLPQVYPGLPGSSGRTPQVTAPLLAGSALATVATAWGEKAIFSYGERLRASGVRCGHTPLALALATATAAAALVDWPALLAPSD